MQQRRVRGREEEEGKKNGEGSGRAEKASTSFYEQRTASRRTRNYWAELNQRKVYLKSWMKSVKLPEKSKGSKGKKENKKRISGKSKTKARENTFLSKNSPNYEKRGQRSHGGELYEGGEGGKEKVAKPDHE